MIWETGSKDQPLIFKCDGLQVTERDGLMSITTQASTANLNREAAAALYAAIAKRCGEMESNNKFVE